MPSRNFSRGIPPQGLPSVLLRRCPRACRSRAAPQRRCCQPRIRPRPAASEYRGCVATRFLECTFQQARRCGRRAQPMLRAAARNRCSAAPRPGAAAGRLPQQIRGCESPRAAVRRVCRQRLSRDVADDTLRETRQLAARRCQCRSIPAGQGAMLRVGSARRVAARMSIAGHTTDGRVDGCDMAVLADDRGALPVHDAVVIAGPRLAAGAPAVLEALVRARRGAGRRAHARARLAGGRGRAPAGRGGGRLHRGTRLNLPDRGKGTRGSRRGDPCGCRSQRVGSRAAGVAPGRPARAGAGAGPASPAVAAPRRFAGSRDRAFSCRPIQSVRNEPAEDEPVDSPWLFSPWPL